MFKKLSFCLLAFVLLSAAQCKDDLAAIIKIDPLTHVVSFKANALRAGETWTKDSTITIAAVNDAVTKAGGGATFLTEVTVNPVALEIPDAANFTFADISNVEIKMNDKSIGKYTGGGIGKKISLTPPATLPDLVTEFKSGSIKVGYTITATKATTTEFLKTTLTININP